MSESQWRVIMVVKSVRTGDVTEINYLSTGNDMNAITAAAMALNESDKDPVWCFTTAIRIERIS